MDERAAGSILPDDTGGALVSRLAIAFFAEHDPDDPRRAAYCSAVVAARHPAAAALGDVAGIDGARLVGGELYEARRVYDRAAARPLLFAPDALLGG